MHSQVLLSTAYFPPAVYFSIMASASETVIERWENYHKQTYRNRCTILGANGPLLLTIPVLRGSFHKTAMRDIAIDSSREWRKQHMRSIVSAYALSPYFEFYIDTIEEAINYHCTFLLDLNQRVTETVMRCIGIGSAYRFSESFIPDGEAENDFRYVISPKEKGELPGFTHPQYTQVFSDRFGFIPGLSIIDVLFNNGPGTLALLQRSLA